MADFLSLIAGIPSLIADFKGSTSDPMLKKKKELNAALSDINNPLYQQLYGQYRAQNQQDLGRGLAEAQAQNRLATKMGRTPLFNPERGGESLFRNLTSGYQNAGVMASKQATENLQQQLANITGLSKNQASVNAQKLSGYQGVGDLLSSLTSGSSYKPTNFYQSQQQASQNTSLAELLKKLSGNQSTGISAPVTNPTYWNG